MDNNCHSLKLSAYCLKKIATRNNICFLSLLELHINFTSKILQYFFDKSINQQLFLETMLSAFLRCHSPFQYHALIEFLFFRGIFDDAIARKITFAISKWTLFTNYKARSYSHQANGSNHSHSFSHNLILPHLFKKRFIMRSSFFIW